MKNVLLASIAALAVTGAAAQAATYSVDVTATPYRVPGSPGLQTRAVVLSPYGPQTFNGATYTFDLNNVGDSVSMDVYGLVTYDTPINADDLGQSPTTATFDFGSLGSTIVSGVSQAINGAATTPSTLGYAIATFAPSFIRVSATEAIFIFLSDTVFGTANGTDFVDGRSGVGMVNATFVLAPIPLPATLPLVVAGLGAMGAVARRRKAKAA